MKKILILLSTISMTPSILPINYITFRTNHQKIQQKYSLDSFKNIVKIVNDKFNDNSKNMESEFMNKLLNSMSWQSFYSKSISEKTGEVLTWNSKPKNDEVTIKTFTNIYKNPNSLPQKRLTQSRTETISETHSFSMTLSEKITSEVVNTITGKIKVPIGEIGDDLSFRFVNETTSSSTWSESKTVTISETMPSQEIMQNPYTILHVIYKITQSTVDYEGIARFKIESLKEQLFRIPFFYFEDNGSIDYMVWHFYSLEEMINILKESGYGEQLNSNQKINYSLISVDNVDNPRNSFVNLPITWSSPNSGLVLDHYEEPI